MQLAQLAEQNVRNQEVQHLNPSRCICENTLLAPVPTSRLGSEAVGIMSPMSPWLAGPGSRCGQSLGKAEKWLSHFGSQAVIPEGIILFLDLRPVLETLSRGRHFYHGFNAIVVKHVQFCFGWKIVVGRCTVKL